MKVQEIQTKSIITKSKLPSADYVVNCYTGCTHKCIYCYAEFMKRFSNHFEDWGEFIDIKNFENVNIPKDIDGKYIFISSVTDPYNHFEIKHEKTKQVLENLKNVNCSVGILTKSQNCLRDIELFKQFKDIEVGFSLNTLDDEFRKLIEPRTSSVKEKICALQELRNNGIKNYLFMSPIFPYITDFKAIIEETKDFVDYYCFENLNLRAEYKGRVLNFIRKHYPKFYKSYIDIYVNENSVYWINLEKEIEEYCCENNVNNKIYFHHD
jgi:DNA repair photolyase